MIWFVAAVAVGNVAVGYVLGARLGWPLRTPLRAPDAEPLLDAQPETPATPLAAPRPAPRPAPAPVCAPQDAKLALDDFRARLAAAGASLHATLDKPEDFERTAGELQKSNHDFLDDAAQRLRSWLPGGDDNAQRDALAEGAEQVGLRAAKIDALLEKPLDAQQRGALVAETDALTDQVDSSARRFETAGDATPSDVEGLHPTLSTLDTLIEALTHELEETGPSPPTALLQFDPPANTLDPLCAPRLQTKLVELLQEVLESQQIVATKEGSGYMVLLSGDSAEEALARIDGFRQQIEATRFEADGPVIKTTVSCAVAASDGCDSFDEVLDRLEAALADAQRLGRNRTYLHDGRIVAPAIPESLGLEPVTVEI